jgi:hypothetical protein
MLGVACEMSVPELNASANRMTLPGFGTSADSKNIPLTWITIVWPGESRKRPRWAGG